MSNLPIIGDSSREQEESRIALTWLRRLESLVPQGERNLFSRALADAGLGRSALDGQQLLSQQHLDKVTVGLRAYFPDITLRLFSHADVTDLGLIGYAAINSDNLGRALRVLYDYHSLASDRYVDSLDTDALYAYVRHTPLSGYVDDYQSIAEDSLMGNWRSVQSLLGSTANARHILASFAYPKPDYAATYFELFGDNCLFGQEESFLRFPREWLDIPINRSSGSLSQVFTAMCERVLGPAQGRADTAEMVQRLLLSRPGRSMLRLEEAAEELMLSPGQLRKRLYRAGTSYKKLVLRTRMELARHYLLDTHLSVQEIAYLLDYATPAPFSRAFKQYYGLAPEYFRQANNGR